MLQDGTFRSPRHHHVDNNLLRELQKEFSARAVNPAWQLTKRKRLVRPFSQGDVGTVTFVAHNFSLEQTLDLRLGIWHADFSPLQKADSYQDAAAKLHQQITGDKPWFLVDPEVLSVTPAFRTPLWGDSACKHVHGDSAASELTVHLVYRDGSAGSGTLLQLFW